MLGGEFDVTEMSFSSYSCCKSRGESRYVGDPRLRVAEVSPRRDLCARGCGDRRTRGNSSADGLACRNIS